MCGLRVSEALSLKVDDIDFSLNCLSVRKAKSDIVTEDIGISTHDLTKRSTYKTVKRLCSILFQLTTSRRGRLFFDKVNFGFYNFNSRPHEEVDGGVIKNEDLFSHFNSRPHEEVDLNRVDDNIVITISTHDLTKRSTRPL